VVGDLKHLAPEFLLEMGTFDTWKAPYLAAICKMIQLLFFELQNPFNVAFVLHLFSRLLRFNKKISIASKAIDYLPSELLQ